METITLLPDPTRFHLEHIASSTSALTLLLSSIQPSAECPLCGSASGRIHSQYSRTLADLPWNRVATRTEQHSACRRERRLCRYEQVIELRRQKLSARAIARKTGICRNTLRKWLDAGCFR